MRADWSGLCGSGIQSLSPQGLKRFVIIHGRSTCYNNHKWSMKLFYKFHYLDQPLESLLNSSEWNESRKWDEDFLSQRLYGVSHTFFFVSYGIFLCLRLKLLGKRKKRRKGGNEKRRLESWTFFSSKLWESTTILCSSVSVSVVYTTVLSTM